MPVPTEIRADRRLLIPGPYPPLTHLGATLLRYATHSSLRYALYQLGEPLPESPPTRFVALRLYLDAVALHRVLARPASAEVLAALFDPGGVAAKPLPRRVRGVLWFHRRRLLAKASVLGRLVSRAPARLEVARDGSTPASGRGGGEPVNDRPATLLSRCLPAIRDAFLGDLVAALDRRQQRRTGQPLVSVQSAEAARFLRTSRVDLTCLGLPDPIVSSWRESIPPAALQSLSEVLLSAPDHRLRGGFRERYRHLLDVLRPSLLALGNRAVEKGYIATTEDVFFVPFDLLDDLDGSLRPAWLEEAIASNRAEWDELQGRQAPADTLGNVEPAPRLEVAAELTPLWPLE